MKLSLLQRPKTQQLYQLKTQQVKLKNIKKIQIKIKAFMNLENKVPQSHLYSLVPQILEWAFQSD